MKTKILFVVILCATVLGVALLSRWPSEQERQDFSSKMVFYEAESSGPIEDCLSFSKLYQRRENVQTECTENYVHFFTPSLPSLSSEKTLKVASFNVFHLGDNQAPLKDLSLMAAVINQWDLIGLQEIMPLSSDESSNNSLLALVIKENPQLITSLMPNWKVVRPGYLALLDELQSIDPSWSLILQATPEGEGSTGEMAGFLYRSSRVQIQEWDYCPLHGTVNLVTGDQARNLACLVQIEEEKKKLISRRAFTSFFKSGEFDFIGLTLHNRFRPVSKAEDLKIQMTEICKHLPSNQKCTIPKDTVGRYYEVLAVVEQMAELKAKASDKDILFMGDFNLEILPSTAELWKATLKMHQGLTPYQNSATTVSPISKKLASNYDHFILDPRLSAECDINSIRTYDFVDRALKPRQSLDERLQRYLIPEVQMSRLNEALQDLNYLVRYQARKGQPPVRGLSEKEIAARSKSLKDALARAHKNHYSAMLEFLSDHVPIEMTCQTQFPDDD